VSGLLTTAALARLRASLTATLPDTCTIRRNTPVSDGAGGSVDGWATVATVACSIAPTGNQPQERAIADRIASKVSYTITLPAETNVTAKDKIGSAGRTFEVVGVIVRSQEMSRRVVVVEVT
jgi:SPP1 family predicted phage head-tail adaptor